MDAHLIGLDLAQFVFPSVKVRAEKTPSAESTKQEPSRLSIKEERSH